MRARLQDSNPVAPGFSSRWWVMVMLAAACVIAASGYVRARQVDRVRSTEREAGTSPYANGRHWLVVPEHHTRSYQWLAQTEQMLTRREWRVRHVANENAPAGRAVFAASPYRWWLGLLARIDQAATGHAIGQAVEQAALWSGPLLHVLLLLTATLYAARRFGAAPAAFLATGIAVLFPFAGNFVPGVADERTLALCFAAWTVLLVSAGLRGHRGDFIWSGIVGALGLWISVSTLVPVLTAISLGAAVLAGLERIGPALPPTRPWDRWALAGAIASLLAYFIEYYPNHLETRLETNHPLYGLAWLGSGLLLALAGRWSRRELRPDLNAISRSVLALAGLAALPLAMKLTASAGFLDANPQAGRLAPLVGSPMATSLSAWFARDGLSLALVATLLPFVLVIPLVRAATKSAELRPLVGFSLGTLVVAVGFACGQLQAWGWCQLLLVIMSVAVWPQTTRMTWIVVALALLPGAVQLAVTARLRDASAFTPLEVEGLIERDIAHWIAARTDTAVATVLASPDRTPALNYFGGLRGLGTPDGENEAGVGATLRILGSTTAEEAQAQLAQREVTHLVLLSWDTELDTLVRWTSQRPEDTFLAALRRWALPPWLQPLPYRLPETSAFEGQSAVILRVTENADRALALSRMAEYALEVQDPALAAAVDDSLQAFPANLVAIAARAQLAKSREDNATFEHVLTPLLQSVANGLDRTLPWDRRVSLAVVLAQAGRTDEATLQLRRCIAELDEVRLRMLGPGALYRMLVLSRALSVPLPGALRDSAIALLPAEARARL